MELKKFHGLQEIPRLSYQWKNFYIPEEISRREQEGQLDEGFLSEVNAQLRQSKEDGHKPGLEALLQKVYQEASRLSAQALQKDGPSLAVTALQYGDKVLVAERFLETIIEAPEEAWNKLLIEGLNTGKGEVTPEEFYSVIKKRIWGCLVGRK